MVSRFLILCFAMLAITASPSFADRSCEVCNKFLGKIEEYVSQQPNKLTPTEIEEYIIEKCDETEVSVEQRLCYNVGGHKTSATRILRKLSLPLSYSKPVNKICEELYKLDPQICDLRYEVQIDISNVDLKTLRVRELRKILSSWNARCEGCIEKDEFISRIEELKPQFVKKDEL